MPCLVSLTGKDDNIQSLSWATWATNAQNDCCYSQRPGELFVFVDLLRDPNLTWAAHARHRLANRPDHLALPHPRKTWWWWDGCGVQGRGHQTQSLCRLEVSS